MAIEWIEVISNSLSGNHIIKHYIHRVVCIRELGLGHGMPAASSYSMGTARLVEEDNLERISSSVS